MASFFATIPALASAGCALAAGTIVGYPAAAIFEGDRSARLLIAPALGLALYGAFAAVMFEALPFTPIFIGIVVIAALGASVVLARGAGSPLFEAPCRVHAAWVVAALALALLPAFAVAPQWRDGLVALGEPVFDHAKAAVVDEIVRNGVPVRNPFYQQAGSPNLFNYYYVWYLIAASVARLTGATGWEADVALTGVTAFVALETLAWAATGYGRRRAAAWWVLAISCAATLRFAFAIFGGPWLRDHLALVHRFEGWIEQASWVPQHVCAATFAVLAVLGVAGFIKQERLAIGSAALVGVLIAASYGSSIWIGGFGLAVVLPALAAVGLVTCTPGARRAMLVNFMVAAGVALALASIFIARNLALIGHRPTLSLWSYPTLKEGSAPLANELAFWTIRLVLDFGFAYVASALWAGGLLFRLRRSRDRALEVALALAIVLPLLVAQHVQSVIANNDLGWRIVLLALFAMTIVASAVAARRPGLVVWLAAAVLLLPGIGAGLSIAVHYDHADAAPDARQFVERVDLWRAVRAVTSPTDAVLDNPRDLADLTSWPANIGWALLSNRRNCAAGEQWLQSLAPQLLPDELHRLDARITRVFDGKGTPDDLKVLARDHLCSALVVVPSDPLWAHPFAADEPSYALVDSRQGWRIYKARSASPSEGEHEADQRDGPERVAQPILEGEQHGVVVERHAVAEQPDAHQPK